MGQKYAAYNAQGAITAFYDSVDSPALSGEIVIEITDAQWQQCLSTPGYTVANGALVAAAVPTAAQIAAQQATQLTAQCESATQASLDSLARAWGYDSIVSAASYANSTVAQYKAEATALIVWRDATWQAAEGLQANIASGKTQAPATAAAFVALMPAAPARPAA